jgi:hypothetical protein
MQLLQEWPLLNDIFGTVEEVRECWHGITAHFLARLQANSFRMMFTACALTPMGYAHIRARDYQFRSTESIDALQEADNVKLMRQKFSHTVEPDEIVEQKAHAIRDGITKSDEQ